MKASLDLKAFEKKLINIAEYSIGFLDGIQGGKTIFLENLGRGIIEALKLYIDAEARTNPKSLHHVYEWYETGSPNARLFDIHQSVNRGGISFMSSFSQSQTLSNSSNEPFYDKARVMEEGKSITVVPKNGVALSFDVDGEQIFTKSPVVIDSPGGTAVEGSFKNIIDEFFSLYFSQAFLRASGLYEYLQKPSAYKHNLPAGAIKGKVSGYEVGFRWITGARIGVK
jgi:hypothetical protein